MIPIYEQGNGNGIGHGLKTFLERFQSILNEESEKKFAIIFYDFKDNDFKKILKDQGVFTKLDRLSGNKLNIFYLHSGSKNSIRNFNKKLLNILDIEDTIDTPSILFFKLSNNEINDISISQLNNQNLIHGYTELSNIITEYMNNSNKIIDSKYIKWISGSSKFITKAGVTKGIGEMIEYFIK